MKINTAKLKRRFNHFALALSRVISQGEITQSSIIIAYYILFSIFPIIIIVGNVLPLFKIDTKPIADYLEIIFPSEVSTFVMPIINSLLKQHSSGFISFGIILAIWSFSSLINSVRMAMNRIYGVYNKEKERSWLHTLFSRTISFLITAIMVLAFALAIFALTFGRQIMEFLAPIFKFSLAGINKIESYRWPAIVLMMILIILYLYYTLPNIERNKRTIWPGVILTTISWIALSYFFGLYIKYFGTRWQNYGIVGSFIVFMLWLNIASLIFLFGSSINASIDLLKYGQASYRPNNFRLFLNKRVVKDRDATN